MTAFKHKTPIQIRFRDIDNLGHVNSAVYFSYFELSRVHYFNALMGEDAKNYWAEVSIVVAKVEMEYKQQILLSDIIYSYVWVSRIGTKSFDMTFSLMKKVDGVEVELAKGMAVLVCINLKSNQTVTIPELWKEKMIQNSEN
jgi:acyl-CoA thioester hydrolase